MASQRLSLFTHNSNSMLKHLSAYLVVCTLLLTGLNILILQPITHKLTAEPAREENNKLAQFFALQLQNTLHSKKNLLEYLANKDPVIASFDKTLKWEADIQTRLNSQGTGISRLVILDQSGQIINDTSLSHANDAEKHDWAKPALLNGKLSLALHDLPYQSLSIAVPIVSSNSELISNDAKTNISPAKQPKSKASNPAIQGVLIGYFNIEAILPPSNGVADLSLGYEQKGVETIKDFSHFKTGEHISLMIEPYGILLHYTSDNTSVLPYQKAPAMVMSAIIVTLLLIAVLFLLGKRLLLNPYNTLAKSHAAMMSITEGISYINCAGRYQYTNSEYSTMTGYEQKELEQESWQILIHPDDRGKAQEAFEEMLETGKACVEVRGQKKEGETFYQHITMIKENKDTHTSNTQDYNLGYYFFVKDITAAKIIAQKSTDLIEELARSNAKLEHFTSVASHDLKAPLRGIKQLSSWIRQDNFDSLPSSSREHFSLIENRILKMERLLDDLLNYSRTKPVGAMQETVELNRFLDNIADLYIKPFGFTYSFDVPAQKIPISEKPLEIVLRNLIDNAIKHHHRSEGHIHICHHKEANEHIITVSDDGPGITNSVTGLKTKEKDQKKKMNIQSSGIGLSIIKKTLARYKGNLHIKSSMATGTSIQTIWPCSEQQSNLTQLQNNCSDFRVKTKAG